MTSYKIFLTKSSVAASLIHDALWASAEKNGYTSAGHGAAIKENCTEVPDMYLDKGYFYAKAGYESDCPKYELIIC